MKVLVAVDGSAGSRNAIKWYQTQHRPENEVILIHVMDAPVSPALTFALGMSLSPKDRTDMVDRWKKEAHSIKTGTTALVKGMPHSFLQREGDPGHVICDVAKKEHVDMVVIGTRGLGKIRRTLLGSVSTYVLHHAHAPVVICPQPDA